MPLRIEMGPKDLEKGQVMCVFRHNGEKQTFSLKEFTGDKVNLLLKEAHAAMLAKATKERDEGIAVVMQWDEVMPALNAKKMILAPWCETVESEE